jgi:RimJ/RimL family protein N-acetyltransferase
VLHHAFGQLQYQKIFAITLPSNYSSIALLVKIGFKYVNNLITTDTNEELSLYSIGNEKLPA